MKKLITKYWGLVLVVVLLSSLFLVGAPASAANYAWATSAIVPTTTSGVLAAAGFGIVDVAQSGSTIYAVGNTGAGTANSLYKSADGGVTWVPQTTVVPTNVATANVWGKVAVAPDDPNTVAILDTTTNLVWLSTTGGSYFSQLTDPTLTIKSIAISPMASFRYIAIGGATGGVGMVKSWRLGQVAPTWTTLTLTITAGDVLTVGYSPNFAADNGLIAVTSNATTGIQAQVYSYNVSGWNTAGMYFPRTIIATADTVNITMTLDANFYLGDLAVQVGFFAVSDATAANGGVYRLDATGTITQIQGGATIPQQINSVAWDGTNLMSAPTHPTAGSAITIYRSANALSTIPTFVPSTTLKTPGTGTYPIVIFNNGVGFAFSQGTNSGVAKTIDLGKSFNAYKLVNSNFNNILDFTVNADGTRVYAVVYDGTDVNLWSKNAGVWARIFVIASPAAAQQTWLVRTDAENSDIVFLGNKGATLMYKSTDGGVNWTIRGAAAAIADFAVQDANTVYAVTSAGATIYKSTTGAFTWAPITATLLNLYGVGYSVTLLADNSVLVGTTGGGVAYSNDGSTFTTIYTSVDTFTAGNTIVTGTGTATGATIFAGSAGGMLAKWVIGTSTSWGVAAGNTFAAPINGIYYANGVLYAINDTANVTYRWINPVTYGIKAAFLSDTIAMSATSVTDQTNMVNALVGCACSNILWARDSQATIDDLISYSDLLVGAASIPTPTYPINNTIIAVNSLSGNTNPFNFMWTVPSAVAPTNGFGFNVQVYMDEAGTIPYAGSSTAVVATFSYTTGVVASTLGTGTPFVGTPGVTYYWRVRTAAANPELGVWSAMQTFSVQQLQAIVPVLLSPANGSYLPKGQTAAFSWNPIAGATSYSFQLSVEPSFANPIYTTTTTSAGVSVPSTVNLAPGTTYYWRVRTLTPAAGEWSTVANFTVAAAPTTAPPAVTVTNPPAITVSIPAATTTVITIPPATTTTTEVNPTYIWAIIIIGAVLVIAVIVLIVRTRRSV